MRRFKTARQRDDGEDNPYWISFSDLMAGLLIVFILAVVVLVLQLTQERKLLAEHEKLATEQQQLFSDQIRSLADAEDVRASTVIGISQRLADKGITVDVSDDQSILSIPTEQIGFAPSSYEIPESSQDVALTIGKEIGTALRADGVLDSIDTVFVEGHTDNRAFSGLEGSGNWGLSTFRAISLWQVWESALDSKYSLSELKRPDGQPLFSVSGYGETRPILKTQDTETDRARNRRVDIRFTVVSPSSEDLTKILEMTQNNADL